MARKAAKTVWTIDQGCTWRQAYQWLASSGNLVDLSTVTEVVAEIRDGAIGDNGTLYQRMTLTGGEIVITNEVQAATVITTALVADGTIVATGADYIDDQGEATIRVRRTIDGVVWPGDDVTVAGQTGGNNGTFEALSVVDADTVTVDTTFTPEAATGTVQIARVGEVVFNLTAGETDLLAWQRAAAQVKMTFPSDVIPFLAVERVKLVKRLAAA